MGVQWMISKYCRSIGVAYDEGCAKVGGNYMSLIQPNHAVSSLLVY